VRHGESQWNEAQAKKDVRGLLSQVDHPLNEVGFQQARALQGALRAALEQPERRRTLTLTPTPTPALTLALTLIQP